MKAKQMEVKKMQTRRSGGKPGKYYGVSDPDDLPLLQRIVLSISE